MANITNASCLAVRAQINDSVLGYPESFYLDLPYYYARNIKQILTFDSVGDPGVIFTNGSHNTAYYKTGDASRGFTNMAGPQTLEAEWSSVVNLAAFNDGDTGANEDYICLAAYIGGTVPDSLVIGFSTSQADYTTKKLEHTISTGLTAGYAFLQIAKSEFTKTGTGFDWSSLAYLKLQYTGGDSTTEVYFDNLQLIRKDPDSSIPNPFQKESSTTWARSLAINSGKWFVGKENGMIVCKNMNPQDDNQVLLGNIQYDDFNLNCDLKCMTDGYLYGPVWYIDNNNYIKFYIDNNLLAIATNVSGLTSVVTTAMTVSKYEDVTFKAVKDGTSVYLEASKATEINNAYFLSVDVDLHSGYLGLCSKAGIDSQVNHYGASKLIYAAFAEDQTDEYWKRASVNKVCSVKFFGAKGDGVNDDTTAIQNAIDYLSKLGGGMLVFPPGSNCKVTRKITLCGNLHIKGDSASIYVDPSVYLEKVFEVNGSYGVQIDLTADVNVGDLSVQVADSSGIQVGDLVMLYKNIWSEGYPTESLVVSAVSATQITFSTPILLPYQASNGAQVWKENPAENISIEGLTIQFSPTSDVLYGIYLFQTKNVRILNVHLKNQRSVTNPTSQAGIYVNHVYDLNMSECFLETPTSDGQGNGVVVGSGTFAVLDQINVTDYYFGIGMSGCVSPKIVNCTLRGRANASVRGIKVKGCQYSAIIGCTVSGYDSGIKYEDSGKGVMNGNTITSCGLASDSMGIDCSSQNVDTNFESYNVISDNIIMNQQGAGIHITAGGYNTTVSDNIITNTTDGGILAEVPAMIHHNMITNWGSATGIYGIKFPAKSVVTHNQLNSISGLPYSFYISSTPDLNDGTVFVGNQAPFNNLYWSASGDYNKIGTCDSNNIKNFSQKIVWNGTIPAVGTFSKGDRVENSTPSPSVYSGWVCTAPGTAGTLSGVTANTTSGSNQVTVNTVPSNLHISDMIEIAGVAEYKVIDDIIGTTLFLNSNCDTSQTGATVTFHVPTFKGFGLIQT